jgi:predicted ThiF/HesA family dinucleotide-utilizing enzyme
MAADPAFANVPRAAVGTLSAANANRDGTGTIVTVFTAGASGSKIEEVSIVPAGTTTAGMVRLYLHDGTTAHLLSETAIAARTPSATVPVTVTTITYENLVLPSGWSLRASTHAAESFKVCAFGGDF